MSSLMSQIECQNQLMIQGQFYYIFFRFRDQFIKQGRLVGSHVFMFALLGQFDWQNQYTNLHSLPFFFFYFLNQVTVVLQFRIGLLINNTLPTLWLDLNFNRSGHFVIQGQFVCCSFRFRVSLGTLCGDYFIEGDSFFWGRLCLP